jgi:hypothetical protein
MDSNLIGADELLKQIKRCLAICLKVLLFLAFTLQGDTFLIVAQQPETGQKLISLVDPFIGTDTAGTLCREQPFRLGLRIRVQTLCATTPPATIPRSRL